MFLWKMVPKVSSSALAKRWSYSLSKRCPLRYSSSYVCPHWYHLYPFWMSSRGASLPLFHCWVGQRDKPCWMPCFQLLCHSVIKPWKYLLHWSSSYEKLWFSMMSFPFSPAYLLGDIQPICLVTNIHLEKYKFDDNINIAAHAMKPNTNFILWDSFWE